MADFVTSVVTDGQALRKLADRLETSPGGDPLVSYASLSRIEQGHQPYSQPIIEAIAAALGVTVPMLLESDPAKEGNYIDDFRSSRAPFSDWRFIRRAAFFAARPLSLGLYANTRSVTASRMALMRSVIFHSHADRTVHGGSASHRRLLQPRLSRKLSRQSIRMSTSVYSRGGICGLDRFSCGQILIGETATNGRAEHTGEPFHRMMAHVAVIEAEGELVDVAVQMLGAGVMINADQAPLHHRKDALDPVRGDVAAHIFARAVVDALMGVEQAADRVVDGALVGVDDRARRNIAIGEAHSAARRNGRVDLCPDAARIALATSDDGGLADRTATESETLALVPVGFLAADIGFVDFDDAAQDAGGHCRRLRGAAEA